MGVKCNILICDPISEDLNAALKVGRFQHVVNKASNSKLVVAERSPVIFGRKYLVHHSSENSNYVTNSMFRIKIVRIIRNDLKIT